MAVTRYVIAPITSVPPGTRLIVELAGRSIGVFNVDGKFFALRNRCPHQGGPLCLGRLTDYVDAAMPGEYNFDMSRKMLRCPWHGWEFDLATGASWFDPVGTRVRSYEVTVRSGADLQSQPICGSKMQPGPYQAEVFPVSVEGAYLAVDIAG